MQSLLYYGQQLIQSQILVVFSLLFGVGFIVLLWERRAWKWIWFWSILGPYIFFTLINVKEPKTMVPYLPVVALISAMGIYRIGLPVVRRGAVSALFHGPAGHPLRSLQGICHLNGDWGRRDARNP